MGANLAGEVADEKFCETTIGCKDSTMGPLLRDIIQTSYFRVVVVDDEDTVEVCGALKVSIDLVQKKFCRSCYLVAVSFKKKLERI